MKLRFVIALALAVTGSGSVQASTALDNYIKNVSVMDNGTAFVTHTGTRSTPPACHTTALNRFSMNTNTAAGANMLAGLLTAYSLHKKVYISGSGNCSHPDTETISYFYTVDD